jgi:hypothetical protein
MVQRKAKAASAILLFRLNHRRGSFHGRWRHSSRQCKPAKTNTKSGAAAVFSERVSTTRMMMGKAVQIGIAVVDVVMMLGLRAAITTEAIPRSIARRTNDNNNTQTTLGRPLLMEGCGFGSPTLKSTTKRFGRWSCFDSLIVCVFRVLSQPIFGLKRVENRSLSFAILCNFFLAAIS